MRGGDLGLVVAALGVAADARKLAVIVVGLVAGWVPALFFFGLAGQPGGGGTVATLLGALVLWAVLSVACGTVAKMSYDQLASGQASHWRDALQYVVAHLEGFLLGPLVAVVGFLLLVAVEVAVLFLGRIPYLGELLVALLFLPILLVNLLAAVALLFGSWLLFPVVAAEGAGAMRAPMRVVEIVRRDPTRVVLQSILVGLLAAVAMIVLFFLSLTITAGLSGMGLGPEKSLQLLGLGPLAGLLGGGGFASTFFRTPNPPWTIGLARFIMSVGLAGFMAALYALPVAFMLATSCAVYLGSGARESPEVTAREPLAASPAVAR